MLFDTHAHYDDVKFEKDMYEVIKKVHDDGVSYIINASSNIPSAVESISLSEKFDYVYAAIGIHPHYVGDMSNYTLSTLVEFARNDKVVAIGEIGLDYYYDNVPREIQKHWFSRQIGLARELNLPIIVHDRDAHEDVLRIIKQENAKQVGGVFHCFTGSIDTAREAMNSNFYISFGGQITYRNAKKIIEVVKYVPDDRLLIETDSPYLTPEPYRGKRNDSGHVKLVAEKIAEIKGKTYEAIASLTLKNAKDLFKISDS